MSSRPAGAQPIFESGLPARRVALDVALAVLVERRPLDAAFGACEAMAHLPERDRAFAFNLVSTMLRRLGQIDALLDEALERPLPAKLAVVRAILRLGAAQLLFLHTPAHAAVDTAVTLARETRNTAQAALVNALLRRLSVDGFERIAGQDAARLDTPAWLWNSWTSAYGEASARAIASAHLLGAPLDLTPKPGIDIDRLAADLGATRLPTGSLRIAEAAPVASLPGYDAGQWWVQDAAAALPAKLLGDVRGKRVFDLCAAPGGKTAQLAAAGAAVVAVDRSGVRLRRLAENLARLGLTAEIVEADVGAWQPALPADAVLLDVPCSSTGTIRRHPDIAVSKTPAEVVKLAAVQRRLLASAAGLLAPGGTLVYCACSLQPEEGAGVVDSLVGPGQPYARVPIEAAEVGGWPEVLTSAGDLRTLPCHLGDQGGLDGFYAARLRKQ